MSLEVTEEKRIETVKDRRFIKRSEMRVFGKNYNSNDVYIKIRVGKMNIIKLSLIHI